MNEKQQRLEYLLAKRDALEKTGRMISLKQSKEIASLRAELETNKTELYGKENNIS